jgi:1,4-dihydroxy-6-naphthoate synthase
MDKIYTLGYSTCPNDTYIFYGLAHGKVGRPGFSFEISLADVEVLNRRAERGSLEITKLSFAAIGHLLDSYRLLRTGAALGKGCGPLIVARPEPSSDALGRTKIAVPGIRTTAHLLLGLYLDRIPEAVPMPFDRIMPAVARGEVDFGVVIHEGRFTFREHGLIALLDLGKWWEETTALPVPLGGIALRRDIGPKEGDTIEALIRESLCYARAHPEETDPYVRTHAREMEPSVISRHIDLYVNSFSIDIGEEGGEAVKALFSRGRERGLLPASGLSPFD